MKRQNTKIIQRSVIFICVLSLLSVTCFGASELPGDGEGGGTYEYTPYFYDFPNATIDSNSYVDITQTPVIFGCDDVILPTKSLRFDFGASEHVLLSGTYSNNVFNDLALGYSQPIQIITSRDKAVKRSYTQSYWFNPKQVDTLNYYIKVGIDIPYGYTLRLRVKEKNIVKLPLADHEHLNIINLYKLQFANGYWQNSTDYEHTQNTMPYNQDIAGMNENVTDIIIRNSDENYNEGLNHLEYICITCKKDTSHSLPVGETIGSFDCELVISEAVLYNEDWSIPLEYIPSITDPEYTEYNLDFYEGSLSEMFQGFKEAIYDMGHSITYVQTLITYVARLEWVSVLLSVAVIVIVIKKVIT